MALILLLLLTGCATPQHVVDCVEAAKSPWPCATEQQIREHGYQRGARPGLPFNPTNLWHPHTKADCLSGGRFQGYEVCPPCDYHRIGCETISESPGRWCCPK